VGEYPTREIFPASLFNVGIINTIAGNNFYSNTEAEKWGIFSNTGVQGCSLSLEVLK